MKIECIRIRPKGTEVELDGEVYHFRPTDTDPRHIAEVSKVAHINTLLAIDAYRVADEAVAEMTGTKKPKTVAAAAPQDPPPVPTIAPAQEGDAQKDGEGATDPNGEAPTGGTPTGTIELDDLTDAQLRTAYQLTLNKAAGGTKRPKLIEALKAAGYVHTA